MESILVLYVYFVYYCHPYTLLISMKSFAADCRFATLNLLAGDVSRLVR